MKISELTDGARNIDLEAEVSEKGETRTVNTRFGNEANVADVKIKDDSAIIQNLLIEMSIFTPRIKF